MKKNVIKLFFSFIVLLLMSCSSDDVQKTTVVSDLYVSGSKATHACYWKNNTLVPLIDVGYTASRGDTLVVMNNDVHILGSGYAANGDPKKLYWKNNVLTNLTDNFSTPTELADVISMDVDSNNDVYFAGITQNTTTNTYDLVYWKNGVKHIVDTFTSDPLYRVASIEVVNNNVYVANTKMVGGNFISGYYINTTFYPVSDFVWGVKASNSDVYVYGRTNVDDFYKNVITNTSTSLVTNLSIMIPIYMMCFDNSNVYALNDLYVYKNGVVFYTVPPPTASYNYSRIANMDVKNNSLYLLNEQGSTLNGSIQKVLKDNVLVMQSASDEMFTSLFVN